MPVDTGEVCVPIMDCSIDQCGPHGTCYMYNGRFRCRCDDGWTGERCDIRAEPVVGGSVLSTGAIIAIVVCMLILLRKYYSKTLNLRPSSGHWNFILILFDLAFIYHFHVT